MTSTPDRPTHTPPAGPAGPAREIRNAAAALSEALNALNAGYPLGTATATHDGVMVHLQPRHAAHLAVRITQDQSQGRL